MNTRFTTLVVVTIIVAVASTISQPTTSGVSASASITVTNAISLPVVNDYGHHSERPDACRTYRFGGYDMSDGEECGLKGSRSFKVSASVSAPVASSVTTNAVTGAVITTAPAPNPVTPAVVVVVDNNKGKGSSCNNGNGNGDEGCNSSEKGNQDETKVKGDKGPEHPGNGNNNK